jgi:hypothetical protein
MSEEQPRWLERNVDVLVQLLQSGAFSLHPYPTRQGNLMLVVLRRRTGGSRSGQKSAHTAPRVRLQSHPRRPLRPDRTHGRTHGRRGQDDPRSSPRACRRVPRRGCPTAPPRAATAPRARSCRARRGANRNPHQGNRRTIEILSPPTLTNS